MRRWLWPSLLICLVPTLVSAQPHRRGDIPPDLAPILRRMLTSSRTARYVGQRVVEFKNGLERARHVELVLRDGPRTRTEFPDESPFKGQVIVENGRQRLHYFPDKNEIRILPQRGDETARRLMHSLGRARREGHRIVINEGGSVAGHQTQLAAVVDGKGNAVQRLWIEPRSGVLLRRELLDRSGNRHGFFEFQRISFTPTIGPKEFEIDRKGAIIVTLADMARRQAKQLGLSFVLLPPDSGYRLDSVRIMRPEEKPVLAMAYGSPDGRFTLFQMKGPLSQSKLRSTPREGLTTYSWTVGEETFLLVGDLPIAKLQQITQQLGDS